MFWPPIRGDGKNQIERVTVTGITGSNSDKGKFYGKITATDVELYETIDRASGDKVATGSHSAPTDWTKITLAQANSSGVSGSLYLKYSEADSEWEVYPQLATDAELEVAVIDFTRWPKQSGQSTFANQLQKTREDFVRMMLNRLPPAPNAQLLVSGTLRGSRVGPWVVNSKGHYELKYLHNVESYREWAIHYTMAHIARTTNHVLEETDQLRVNENEMELADKAWAETIPLYDDDADMDADREEQRFRIFRA